MTLKEAISSEHQQVLEFLSYAKGAGVGPEAQALSQAHLDELTKVMNELQRDTRYRLVIEPHDLV